MLVDSTSMLLGPYLKGTYVTYPYLGYRYSRVLVHHRYNTRYLITTSYRMWFLHILPLVASLECSICILTYMAFHCH